MLAQILSSLVLLVNGLGVAASKDAKSVNLAMSRIDLLEGFHRDPESISIALGEDFTCALERRPSIEIGGPARCWGRNDLRQCTPPEDSTFIQISGGKAHSCGIKVDQTISCWGLISAAPYGLYQQVSAGSSHSCALTLNGSIKCWGDNAFGKCNNPSDAGFVQVSSGGASTCALHRNGHAHCWGDNSFNQSEPPINVQFNQISLSFTSHACGLTIGPNTDGVGATGDLICWGRNVDGGPNYRPGPYHHVTCGSWTTCAISSIDNSVTCWNVKNALQTSFIELVASQSHICGLDMNNVLLCWGSASGAEKVPHGFQIA